jgi:hypothetical protein
MNEIAGHQFASRFTHASPSDDPRLLSGEELRALFRSAIRTLDTAPPPVTTDGLPDLEATMDALMDALVERLQEQQVLFSMAPASRD